MPIKRAIRFDFLASAFLHDFFRVISLEPLVDQAVACAKAAGRMLAVASAGEVPDLEPVIAKPLAMAAMTETYKVVSREKQLALRSFKFLFFHRLAADFAKQNPLMPIRIRRVFR